MGKRERPETAADLNHREGAVHPARAAVHWYVLVPRGNAEVFTVRGAPVKALRQLVCLYEGARDMVEEVFLFIVLVSFHIFLPALAAASYGATSHKKHKEG